jgi:phosphopantothenoylcysteine decarboxylase/phosphopantothenate--cysteine ligase
MLEDKKILLGVTGGIACYKSAELVRLLVKNNATVNVVMTESATKFVTPLTFQTLSMNPVLTDTFDTAHGVEIKHISLPQECDIFVIAPATANVIGKIAGGIGDDLLTSMVLACTKPILIVPSMNNFMWENKIVQENIRKLKEHGFLLMEPGEGFLACGYEGKGRMPEPEKILEEIVRVLTPKDMLNRKILVTAGPTREAIDPVRFITNPSTGKMGFAIAREARNRGAIVTLISGPAQITPPGVHKFISVTSADEMADAVFKEAKEADIVIMTSAVADYKPARYSETKIKKNSDRLNIELVKTVDILKKLGENKGKKILVGFAAETDNIEENAIKKLKEKNLDLIVVNKIGEEGSGFGADTNKVMLIFRDGRTHLFDKMQKSEVAKITIGAIVKLGIC